MLYSLFRLLHLLAMLALAGAIIIQNMAIAERVSAEDITNLGKLNRAVAISSAIVVLLGLLLWLGVGRPAAFYNSNSLFHTKLGLVMVLAALSVPVTLFLRRGRQMARGDTISVPRGVRLALRVELVLLVVIPLLAWLMARGIGVSA